METTGAIILAAGGSSRLGTPKQFLLHHGKSLLEHSVEAAKGCAPIVVVTGRDSARMEDHLAKYEVILAHNDQWESGIGSSIRRGVASILEIAPNLDSLVILVCDQIRVTVETIRQLRELRRSERKPMAACHYANALGVPALFSRKLFDRLITLPDACGAKVILAESPEIVSAIPFPEGALDIDTSADVQTHLDGAEEMPLQSKVHGGAT